MSYSVPSFISSGISTQYQYLKSLKSAQESGQAFNYKTGEIGTPAPPQNSAMPFNNDFLQGYISQNLPQFGFGGMGGYGFGGGFPPNMLQQVGNPFHSFFFSPLLMLQYDIMNKLTMLNQLLNNPDGEFDFGGEFSRRSRGGILGRRDPGLRGNNALDVLLDGQKVDTSETDANADGDTYHFSDADFQAFKDGIANGDFSQRDLGIALMAKMKRINSSALDEYQGLITRLVNDGTLQPRALFNPYLKAMDEDRQQMVMQGLADAGVSTDGRTNLPFGGFMLQNVQNEEKVDLQNLLRDLLFRYYDNALSAPDSDASQRVFSLLTFMGFDLNEDGSLADGEQPFELKAYVNTEA